MNREMNTYTKHALGMAVAAVAGLSIAAAPTWAGPGESQTGSQANQSDQVVIEGQAEHQDQQQSQQQNQTASAAHRPTLPQGIEESNEPADKDDVRSVLTEATNAATLEEGFDDMVERFADQDRNRFGEWMDKTDDMSAFRDATQKFEQAYQQKFGKELELQPEQAFADVAVAQGEVKDPQQVASNWPVQPVAGAQASQEAQPGQPRLAGSESGEIEDNAEERDEGIHEEQYEDEAEEHGAQANAADNQETNLEEGRQVAVAAVSGPENAPTLQVSLINEFPGTWKIDVPNKRKPEQVYQDVTQRLEKLASQVNEWPDDAQKVQSKVGYELLAAVYGIQDSQSAHQRMDHMRQDTQQRSTQDRTQSGQQSDYGRDAGQSSGTDNGM